MSKKDLANRLGFGQMFPEAATKQAADEPAGASQDAPEELDSVPAEPSKTLPKQPSEEEKEKTEETSPEATDTAEEPEDAAAGDPEDAGDGEEELDKQLGNRAQKRIKQLNAKAKEAETRARLAEEAQNALKLELAKLQGQVSEISSRVKEPQQEKSSAKTWEDLTVDELDFIADNHPEYADKVKQYRPLALKKMIRQEADAAVKSVREELSAREQAAIASQQAQKKYPELAIQGSPLRTLAEKIYSETGIPELGISAKDLQSNPRGVLIASREAFARLAEEKAMKPNGSKKPPVTPSEKAGAALLNGGGRSPATVRTQNVDRHKSLKNYVAGKTSLESLLAERGIGAGLPSD